MNQLTKSARPRLFIAIVVLFALATVPASVRAGGPIKGWSGVHLGNRPSNDWDSALLARVDGDNGGIWPNAVVFLSSQLYNLSRDANCRIKTGPYDVTTGRPVLLNYLQRASQNGVRIIIRIEPSPGNFDANHRLISGSIQGIGYCDPTRYRPAFDMGVFKVSYDQKAEHPERRAAARSRRMRSGFQARPHPSAGRNSLSALMCRPAQDARELVLNTPI